MEAELEAEFFGSDDGAGHVTAGALELANGGTLFLDEIEKFPTRLEDVLADALRNGVLNWETGTRRKFNVPPAIPT